MKAKVTFGIIVLNGQPFVRANLKALYPFAHEIIIVEGASPNAKSAATVDGHSIDGTLQVLRDFAKTEDPEGKVHVITAEDEGHPNGFWPGEKTQQSQGYAKRATGDWIWQVDIDEFYHAEEMERIIGYLAGNPDVSCVRFSAYHFWGGFDHVVEGGFMWHPYYQGEPFGRYRRVFRWKPGWHYATHRPPTILDESGRDVTRTRMVNAEDILGKGPIMYHYFMVDTGTILKKAEYYQKLRPDIFSDRRAVCEEILTNLTVQRATRLFDQFGTRNWLEKFSGQHPKVIRDAISDSGGLLTNSLPAVRLNEIVKDRRYILLVAALRTAEKLKSVGRALKFILVLWIIGTVGRLKEPWLKVLPGRWRRYREPHWFLAESEKLLLPAHLRKTP